MKTKFSVTLGLLTFMFGWSFHSPIAEALQLSREGFDSSCKGGHTVAPLDGNGTASCCKSGTDQLGRPIEVCENCIMTDGYVDTSTCETTTTHSSKVNPSSIMPPGGATTVYDDTQTGGSNTLAPTTTELNTTMDARTKQTGHKGLGRPAPVVNKETRFKKGDFMKSRYTKKIKALGFCLVILTIFGLPSFLQIAAAETNTSAYNKSGICSVNGQDGCTCNYECTKTCNNVDTPSGPEWNCTEACHTVSSECGPSDINADTHAPFTPVRSPKVAPTIKTLK